MTRRPAAAAGVPGGGAQQKAEEHRKETAATHTADPTHKLLYGLHHRRVWMLHMVAPCHVSHTAAAVLVWHRVHHAARILAGGLFGACSQYMLASRTFKKPPRLIQIRTLNLEFRLPALYRSSFEAGARGAASLASPNLAEAEAN